MEHTTVVTEVGVPSIGPSSEIPEPSAEVPAPSSVGRYLLLEQIGKGGMGTVFAGFDPKLDRRVAIKLIYAGPTTVRTPRSQESLDRLEREAQAIAQVDHPNVITVHDVGAFEFAGLHGVFMVMELVEGTDLRHWLRERERSLEEILPLFLQAGRGLEAAHQKGIVHRDFKPSNVLVDGRGRARVLDFGLARGVGDPDPEPEPEELARTEPGAEELEDSHEGEGPPAGDSQSRASASHSSRSSMLTAPLTRHGAVMGTPRYMSPEQHATSVVDVRSDQYSFCLALYIALFRRVPFDESKLLNVARAKINGIEDWSGDVPQHIVEALRRGLHPDPERRWPDMASLVDALADDPRVRRRRWLFGGLAVLGLAGVIGGSLLWDRQAIARCQNQRAWIAERWGLEQQDAIAQAFGAVEAPYAEQALAQVDAQLSDYGNELAGARAQLCTKEHRGQLSEAVAAARMACLDERRDRLGAVVERFSAADAATVEHAAELLAALPPIADCAEAERRPELLVEVDPTARREVEAELFALRLVAAAGGQPEALARLDPLIEQARALDDPHTLARVLIRGGELYGAARKLERAEALLSEGTLLAERHGNHDLAIDGLLGLAHILQSMPGHWDEAQRSLDLARAKYAREPGGSKGEWHLHYTQSAIYGQHDEKERAIDELELAVAKAREEQQPAMVLAKALNALAFAQARAGLLSEAERHAQESLAIRVELYGPEHPSLMYPLRALADIARDRELPKEAIEHLDRSIALGRSQLGPDAPGLVSSLNERAKDLRALGRYEDALADYEEAERILKVNDRPVGDVLRMQSQVLLRLDRPEQALERAEAALAAHREQLGDDEQQPWLRARFVMHRGEALLALGRDKDALLAFERAAELRAAKQEDGLMLRIWAGAGEAELALGHRERARELFERAWKHRVDGFEDNARTNARIDFGMARTEDDALLRRRAADMAIDGFEGIGDEERAEQVRAWLESVSSP